jgi:hypothetical protein
MMSDERPEPPRSDEAVPVVPTSPVVPAYERQGVPVDDDAEPPDADHGNGEG